MVGMFCGNNNHINLKKKSYERNDPKSILNCLSVMVRMKEMDQGLLKKISIAFDKLLQDGLKVLFFSSQIVFQSFHRFRNLSILDLFFRERKICISNYNKTENLCKLQYFADRYCIIPDSSISMVSVSESGKSKLTATWNG